MNSKIDKKVLKKKYFSLVKNARYINPLYRSFFNFFYQLHLKVNKDEKLLNIYSSNDASSGREEIYRKYFFNQSNYYSVDFWGDHFISKSSALPSDKLSGKYSLSHLNNKFDYIVTTKILIEHVSEPGALLAEFSRVLNDNGELYIIFPLVRRQHQLPHDYFRFTESSIRHLLDKASLTLIDITPTNGFFGTVGSYFYFLQRGLRLPRIVERFFDFIVYWLVEPFFFFLDKLDNGYGRDMTQYFLVRAKKESK